MQLRADETRIIQIDIIHVLNNNNLSGRNVVLYVNTHPGLSVELHVYMEMIYICYQ